MVQRSSKGSTERGARAARTRTPPAASRPAPEASASAPPRAEVWPGIDDVDPEQSVREQRHPSGLADPVETDATDTVHPVERQAHPRPERRRSGTLTDAADAGGLPVHEPGVSLEPEDMGVQFLRDATEQGNFESQLQVGDERGEPAIEPLVSEASLSSAGQEDVDLPTSSALELEPSDEGPEEGAWTQLDMQSDVLREVSLLDQGVDADASSEAVEEAQEAEQPPDRRTQTRSPTLRTDEVSAPEEALGPRENEKRRMLRRLRKQRPRPREASPDSVR